jgi:hypothetical protein
MTYGSKKGRADLKHGGADLVGPTYQETFSGASSSLPHRFRKIMFSKFDPTFCTHRQTIPMAKGSCLMVSDLGETLSKAFEYFYAS